MLFRKTRANGAVDRERDDYLFALNQAQSEYEVAKSCFSEAVEPEIIDEAIFLMQAARKKYSYFLKKVRESSTRFM
ncbi:MAG TPA: DUF2508 family protein [Firmicutes bacterium]|jgi:hypothetical protein|nr:DUF2508 family protein [Candidatus Fermentithermobacillaceae bacterium]